jgi:hypothetical protein
MAKRTKLFLALFGVALALVTGFLVLRPTAQEMTLASCQPAPGDWNNLVVALLGDYRKPCDDFFWRPLPTDEFHNRIHLNNYGLHDTMLTLEKPAGVYRVLVVGDSATQGWQVPLEQGFPYLMEQASDGQIEVINLSVDAFGTDRELLLYSFLGWRFQPDLVLLAVYMGNDVLDNNINLETHLYGRRLERPYFTLDNGVLHLHNSPTFSLALFDSPAYHWLTQMQADNTPPPPENLPTVPRVISEDPYNVEYPEHLGMYLPDDAHWTNAWALTQALIVQMRDLAQAQGSRFAVVLIPDRRAIHTEDWDYTVQQYPFLQGIDPVSPNTRMEDLLIAQGIPTLNLVWNLRAWLLRNIDQRLYYGGDGHLNANGHAVAAQRIYGWLNAEQLVP